MAFATSDILACRHVYPALRGKTYLNYGGQGPLCEMAWQVLQEGYDHIQTQGPFASRVFPWISTQLQTLRQSLALLLGTTPDTIALTDSVTMGCNIAMWGLNWQPGDHLLISNCEHPGVLAIAAQLEHRLGVTVDIVPLWPYVEDVASHLEGYLHPRTRLLVISHLLWNSGQILPLKEIVDRCHHNGTKVLADAAQSVGMIPLDLPGLGVDYYAFTGHKWCCGPGGLGGIYIHPDQLEQLEPTFVGWRGIHQNRQGLPAGWKGDASRYEVATIAFPLIPALTAALEVHQGWGSVGDRHQRICELSDYLWQNLQQLPGITCLSLIPPPSGLVSFQLADGRHGELVSFLEAENILVREILNPAAVRACVHYFSLRQECDLFLERVAHFLA